MRTINNNNKQNWREMSFIGWKYLNNTKKKKYLFLGGLGEHFCQKFDIS